MQLGLKKKRPFKQWILKCTVFSNLIYLLNSFVCICALPSSGLRVPCFSPSCPSLLCVIRVLRVFWDPVKRQRSQVFQLQTVASSSHNALSEPLLWWFRTIKLGRMQSWTLELLFYFSTRGAISFLKLLSVDSSSSGATCLLEHGNIVLNIFWVNDVPYWDIWSMKLSVLSFCLW